MPRNVRCGLIQVRCEWSPEKLSLGEIKEKMIAKHERLIADAAKQKVQVLGLQELFYGPYFCAEQQTRWYELTERVPNGPTISRMQKLAKKHQMVLVVPIYEVEMAGVYYNTAAVIDADGRYLGKYRKHHIPHCHPGFWEKFYFTPGNAGYPVFETRYARVGVYICYDRHFPEGARILGLNGAEIVYNPSATVAGLSEYLWEHRTAMENRRVLREKLLLQSARENCRAGESRQGRAACRRPEPGRNPAGARYVAVLSRSAAGVVR